jgi:hypothetical protein
VRLQIAGRISSLLAAAPRHQRALLVPLTSQAQQALRSPLGAGAEQTLLALSRATEINAEWLERIAALSKHHTPRTSGATEPALVVLILLRRSRGQCARE